VIVVDDPGESIGRFQSLFSAVKVWNKKLSSWKLIWVQARKDAISRLEDICLHVHG
jgi:hypothetical protein